ncbi:MAG: efflux RND transporter permease subunit [Planctomycetes bacterium]|nr:efflux RND transporter permease subunit [Planctomycetota bacterium]
MSRFFIDRPVFAMVLSIVIVIFGAVAVVKLPIAQYPEVAPPTISISATYPGANAVDVAENVATPIENEVNGVENMIYMLSKCTNDGQMTLDVTFKPGTDLNMAQVLVQNRVAVADAKLPEEVKRQGVTTKKKSPSILLCVNLISEKVKDPKPGQDPYKFNQLYLSNYATLNVKDTLARIPGVGDVTFLGPRDYSMRIWLDPQKTASLGMTPSEVVSMLREQNRQVPAGRVGQPPIPLGQDFQYPLSTQSRLTKPEEFGEVILKSDKGVIVKLKDVVRTKDGIELGAKNYDVESYLDGQPSVTLAVFQLPGSNALETAAAIKKAMKDLSGTFPEGVKYDIVYDTTVFIDESITAVYHTLIEAIVLVFIVVLVFLQNWRATLIPMIAVPVSLVGTFAIMSAMGFSLNNLSLFGLVLAIGIVVDDAIVVVENVERYLAMGFSPLEASRKAMDEVSGPVIGIALVLCAVFVPTAFLAGITGEFFKQFALTIATSTVISAFNSLTLSPALCSMLLKAHGHGKKEDGHGEHVQAEALPRLGIVLLGGLIAMVWLGPILAPMFGMEPAGHGKAGGAHAASAQNQWLFRAGVFAIGAVAGWFGSQLVNLAFAKFFKGFNWTFDKAITGYGRVVTLLLRVCVIALVVYVGLLAGTVGMFQVVPGGFIPEQDKGYLVVNAQLQEGAALERTQEAVLKMTEIAMTDERFKDSVSHVISVPGYSILTGTNISNVGGMFVILKPFEERRGKPALSAPEVAKKLREVYREKMISANVAVFGAPPIDGLGSTGGFKLQVQDRGSMGPRGLEGGVANLAAAGNKQSGLVGLFSSYSARQPQYSIDVDRDMAMTRDVSLTELYDTLGIYFGSAYVNDFTRFGRNWQVIVQADPVFRKEIGDLSGLKVRNRAGNMVSLEAFIKEVSVTGPAIYNRYNMFPSAEINGATSPGTSSGDAINIMNSLAKRELPSSMSIEWTELSFQEIEAAKDPISPFIFPLSILFVFLVLAAQYESWSLPFSIILIVPMCVLCAMIGIWLCKMDNNIFTQIGLVVLVGLAAKNAILIVEFAKQKQGEGLNRFDAAVEASKLRLRPILMTSFAFILGVVPLVLAKGAGAEMRQALGIAVFSGMLGVTLFGIFLTPVFYFVMRWLVEGKVAAKPADGEDGTANGGQPATSS